MQESNNNLCELCGTRMARSADYSEDFAVQTALADRLEANTGERVNIATMSRLCDDCYSSLNINNDELETEDIV